MRTSTTTGGPSRATTTATPAMITPRENSVETTSNRKLLRSTRDPAGGLRKARGARRATTASVSHSPNLG